MAGTVVAAATTTVGDLMTFFQDNLGINTTVPDDGDPATPTAGISLVESSAGSVDRLLNITGNLGLENKLQIKFEGSGNRLAFNDSTVFGTTPSQDSARTNTIVYDSLGAPVTINVTTVLESKATNSTTWRFYIESPDSTSGGQAIGTGTLTFDGNGSLVSSTGTRISIPRDGTGAATPLTFDLDVSELMCLNNGTLASELNLAQLDGSSFGTLQSFSVGENGIITGNFDNGTTRTLGQLAVALFSNPQALIDSGGNMFSEGPGSGAAMVATPGSLGAGKIQARSLEGSNVDLSEEFVNLIMASTGFAASSRVITTSKELIDELLNTSR
jgi:flagellar hook protein FlgE